MYDINWYERFYMKKACIHLLIEVIVVDSRALSRIFFLALRQIAEQPDFFSYVSFTDEATFKREGLIKKLRFYV